MLQIVWKDAALGPDLNHRGLTPDRQERTPNHPEADVEAEAKRNPYEVDLIELGFPVIIRYVGDKQPGRVTSYVDGGESNFHLPVIIQLPSQAPGLAQPLPPRT